MSEPAPDLWPAAETAATPAPALERFRLRRFEPALAPIVSSWIRGPRELRLVSPFTSPPVSADKVCDWGAPGHAPFVFEDGPGRPLAYGELVRSIGAPEEIWIGHVVVDHACRNRGVGRAFTDALLERAFGEAGIRHVRLSVFSDNPRAAACYRRCGFRETGRRPIRTAWMDHPFTLIDMWIERYRWEARRWKARLLEALPGVDWIRLHEDSLALRRAVDPCLDHKRDWIRNYAASRPEKTVLAAEFSSGPAWIAAAVLEAAPRVRVTCFDPDPLMLLIGEMALGPRFGGRISFEPADWNDAYWAEGRHKSFGLAYSCVGLHRTGRASPRRLVACAGESLEPRGCYIHCDRASSGPFPLLLDRLLRSVGRSEEDDGARLWREGWARLLANLGIAGTVEAMDQALGLAPDRRAPVSGRSVRNWMRRAGFREEVKDWRRDGQYGLIAVK